MMITSDLYFSREANEKFLSVSQFKAFLSCEAAAMAELRGETVREETPSMLVGSYVDAHFSKTLDLFRAQHPQIYMKNGDLKSEYRKAEEIIARIERDELFMRYIGGESQVILTGELFGAQWKIKMDSYHEGKAIVDLKIMRDMKPVYLEAQGRVNFAEAWGYDIQGAVYQAIEGNNLPFYLAVATKEKEPDIAVIEIPQHKLDAARMIVEHNIERILAVKTGAFEPTRCEKCDYCRRTRVLDKVISLDDLDEVGAEAFEQ